MCFSAGYLYPLFGGGRVPFTGGAEVQQAQLARGLAARGFDVTVVTCDYGQRDAEVVDGVRLLKTWPPHGGVPVLRFFHPRLTRTVRALSAADAEVYYVRAAGMPAGIACDVARLRRAAFVFGAAHDHDALRALPHLTDARARWWYRRALGRADLVIAQTEFQRALFRSEFGRASEVVPNVVEIPAVAADPGHAGDVLWLATYKAAKRPEWFLALARALPSHRFVMCGVLPVPPDPMTAWDEAQAAARALPNLEVRGFVARESLGALFSSASLMVHTSPVEGFPNTVLEAWAYGVPTLSVVDPDGVVGREGLGATAADLSSLVDATRRWMADPSLRREAGAKARAYVRAHHAPGVAIERFASLLDGVVGAVRTRRA